MDHQAVTRDTYPRQKARTRSFQLGRPRSMHPCDACASVWFVRSSSATDPFGDLWRIDALTGEEFLLVDARSLAGEDDQLPAAERARRERMREVSDGITAYSMDSSCTRAVFAVSGTMYVADLTATSATVRMLPTPGSVVDPRISPNGKLVAFVCDRAMYIANCDDQSMRCVAAPAGTDDFWGLADFISAEELDRHRGHWWLTDSSGLIIQHTDESNVAISWIADPAYPDREPVAHRYPMAGTPNPSARLYACNLDGTLTELTWDRQQYEYVAGVHVSVGGVLVTLAPRDQTSMAICDADPTSGTMTQRACVSDAHWVDVISGSPALGPSGQLLTVRVDAPNDCYRLFVNDTPLSPVGLQVSGIVDVNVSGVVVSGCNDPLDHGAWHIAWDGKCTLMTTDRTYSFAVADAGTWVEITAGIDSPMSTYTVHHGDRHWPIGNLAARPLVTPKVHWTTAGELGLHCAVLLPTDHVPGTTLPVIMSPYGGPHAQRVVRAAAAYTTDQWLADQGFAVVVVDGRGTPGRGPAWERQVANDLATKILADQVDALISLGSTHPDLDLTRAGIRGWSFGGYLAALAVLDAPQVFAAAVAGAPVTDWALYDTAYTERYLGNPESNAAAYERTSLLPRASQLSRPLLIIHGLADDNVLVAHTLQLSSALLAAGRSHSVLPLSGVTHMTPQEIVAENLLLAEVEFFTAHLA